MFASETGSWGGRGCKMSTTNCHSVYLGGLGGCYGRVEGHTSQTPPVWVRVPFSEAQYHTPTSLCEGGGEEGSLEVRLRPCSSAGRYEAGRKTNPCCVISFHFVLERFDQPLLCVGLWSPLWVGPNPYPGVDAPGKIRCRYHSPALLAVT